MPLSTDKKWLKGRNKHMTGFCNDSGKPGQHEGQKPRSGGKPLPTCPFWQECPCVCHQNVDMLFEVTGMERQEVPNPEYAPVHGEFVMPDVTFDPIGNAAVTSDDTSDGSNPQEIVATPHAPVLAPLAARRTDTGRAARGGLEAQVWDACSHITEHPITPKAVGEWIVERYKIPTPSSGAINAVWDRWVKLNFAEQAKKPNRFVKFTGSGTWEELSRMKASIKRQQKSAASAARRGFR